MVNDPVYFELLQQAKTQAPISLHLAYDPGGAEKGKRQISKSPNVLFDAMRKDIATFKRLWAEA